MPKEDKLRAKVLAKPAEIDFEDLEAFLLANGWHERPARGSHHTFWKPGLPEILTIPTVGGRKVKRSYIAMAIKMLGLEE